MKKLILLILILLSSSNALATVLNGSGTSIDWGGASDGDGSLSSTITTNAGDVLVKEYNDLSITGTVTTSTNVSGIWYFVDGTFTMGASGYLHLNSKGYYDEDASLASISGSLPEAVSLVSSFIGNGLNGSGGGGGYGGTLFGYQAGSIIKRLAGGAGTSATFTSGGLGGAGGAGLHCNYLASKNEPDMASASFGIYRGGWDNNDDECGAFNFGNCGGMGTGAGVTMPVEIMQSVHDQEGSGDGTNGGFPTSTTPLPGGSINIFARHCVFASGSLIRARGAAGIAGGAGGSSAGYPGCGGGGQGGSGGGSVLLVCGDVSDSGLSVDCNGGSGGAGGASGTGLAGSCSGDAGSGEDGEDGTFMLFDLGL